MRRSAAGARRSSGSSSTSYPAPAGEVRKSPPILRCWRTSRARAARTHPAAEPGAGAQGAAGARVEEGGFGMERGEFGDPGGGARDEGEADQPVARPGLLDMVAEPGERPRRAR